MKTNRNLKSRIISLLLVFAMLITVIPQLETKVAAVDVLGPKLVSGGLRDMQWPLERSKNIQSCFYDKCSTHPASDSYPKGNHYALDIAGEDGEPVRASYGGTIVAAYNSCPHVTKGPYCSCGGGYGNYVIIQHEYKSSCGTVVLYTRYSHMASLTKTSGSVSKGEQIGTVGSSGKSDGYHVDFQILYNNGNTIHDGYYNRFSYSIDPFANNLLELPSGLVNYDGCDYQAAYYNQIKELYKTPLTPQDYAAYCTSKYGYTATAAKVEVTNKSGAQLWSNPGQNDTAKSVNSSYSSSGKSTAKYGTQLKVVGYLKNTAGNYWYKLDNGSWVYSGKVERRYWDNSVLSSSGLSLSNYNININGWSNLQGTLNCASGGLSYSVAVKYATSRTGAGSNMKTGTYSGSISLKGHELDKGTVFSNIGRVGTYYLYYVLSANVSLVDKNGKKSTGTITHTSNRLSFNITNSASSSGSTTIVESSCSAPKITDAAIANGRRITIALGDSSEAISTYTITRDGTKVANGGAVKSYSYDATVPGTYVVTATEAVSERNSKTASQTFTVSRVATPGISYTQYADDAKVTISSASGATVYYTTDGSIPTASSAKYTGTISVTLPCTVKALAVKSGNVDSETATKEIVLTVPAAPSVTRLSAEKIAQGDAMQVNWQPIDATKNYTATLYKDGTAVDRLTTTGTTASFVLEEVGEYSIRVCGTNFMGTGSESYAVSAESMAPRTVTFTDWNDSVLETQSVRYGYTATTPASPSRRGYTFAGWGSRGLENITEDTTYQAQYDIIYYDVRFYSYDGTLMSYQSIPYLSPAEEPEFVPSDGYVFSGWNISADESDSACDFNSVDSDMTITAVQTWENFELPVLATITSAQRSSSTGNYAVTVDLKTPEGMATSALLRVTLKNDAGQMVKTTSREIEIITEPDETITETVTLISSDSATMVEVEVLGVVEDNRTGSAYSQAVTASLVEQDTDITWGDWSAWTEEPIADNSTTQVEHKTQYRYRTKTYTTSTSNTLAGWTLSDSSNVYFWGPYGAWSNWSTTEVVGSDSVNVETRSTYQYYYYLCPYCGTHSYTAGVTDTLYGGCGHEIPETAIHYVRSTTRYGATSEWYDVGVNHTWSTDEGLAFAVVTPGDRDYTAPITQYRYQTRALQTTYTFYKWSEWSEWIDKAYTASSVQAVESRTAYRSRTLGVPEAPTTAEEYYVSGILNSVTEDLSGKVATIMVYNTKNTDPNEDQLQYIGQTVIGEDNIYDFTFIPRLDPTIDTGDYVVALGIQGSTGLVNVGVIEAPRPAYTVTYQGIDGSVLAEYSVEEGESAPVPEAPEVEGYTFTTWSTSAANVHNNLTVSAIYTPVTYVAIFVDWAGSQIGYQLCNYGEAVNAPFTPNTEGYTFNGWTYTNENGEKVALTEGGLTIRDSVVLEADYTPNTYTVTFSDGNGGVYTTQTVAYGEAAELPQAGPEVSGKVFMDWSNTAQWWKVTKDITVEPILVFDGSVAAPSYTFNEVNDVLSIVLTSSTEHATIYYTVDGSIPNEDSSVADGDMIINNENLDYDFSTEYDEETGVYTTTITRTANVKAYAVADEMNDSEILEFSYTTQSVSIYDPNNIDGTQIYVESTNAAPGTEATINVSIKENPGICAYVVYLTYDTDMLEFESAVTAYDGFFYSNDYRDSEGNVIGRQFVFLSLDGSNITTDGPLFSMQMQVAENASGKCEMQVSYSEANMINADTDIVYAYTGDGTLSAALMAGDVNMDSERTLVDAMLILRNIVELVSFNEHQIRAADLNGNGATDVGDVILLLQAIIGSVNLDG